MVDSSMVEDHFDVALPAGGPRSGNGLAVFLEPEPRSDHFFQAYLGRQAEGEGEAARRFSFVLFDAVGVAPAEAYLLVPERGEVEAALRGGHPHEGRLATGSGETGGVLHRAGRTDALVDPVGPAHDDRLAQFRLVGFRPQHLREGGVGVFGMNHLVGPETERLFSLSCVLGDADDASGFGEVAEGGEGEESDTAGTYHQAGVAGVRCGFEGGVHGAGEGFHGDCGLIGNGVGDAVELRRMGDQGSARPAAARVVAEARLDAGAYVALRHVQAQGVAARGAVGARWVDAAYFAAEGRYHEHAFSGLEAGVVFGYLSEYF